MTEASITYSLTPPKNNQDSVFRLSVDGQACDSSKIELKAEKLTGLKASVALLHDAFKVALKRNKENVSPKVPNANRSGKCLVRVIPRGGQTLVHALIGRSRKFGSGYEFPSDDIPLALLNPWTVVRKDMVSIVSTLEEACAEIESLIKAQGGE